MNKEINIDLSKLLKNHEGETFYTPLYGDITFIEIIKDYQDFPLLFSSEKGLLLHFTPYGKYCKGDNAECLIFPSKDQRDWNKWIKEQKLGVPKFKIGQFVRSKRSGKIYEIFDNSDIYNYIFKETPYPLPEHDLEDAIPKAWSEYCKIVPPITSNDYRDYPFAVNNSVFTRKDVTPIEKSALALLKIHQLIEFGYGGNITNDEWNNPKVTKYAVIYRGEDIEEVMCSLQREVIAFHTVKQRTEFLKYPENIRLIKNYYMIP